MALTFDLRAVCALVLVCLMGCAIAQAADCANPSTVDTISLPAYMGRWYEIATNQKFREMTEKDLVCNTANYTLNSNGEVTVFNYGYKHNSNGTFTSATGKAVQVSGGKLKVSFFLDFFGPYWVIDLFGEEDQGYSVAVIYSCSKTLGIFEVEDLWFLSRTPQLPADISYDSLVKRAEAQGINVANLQMTKTYHGDDCVYKA